MGGVVLFIVWIAGKEWSYYTLKKGRQDVLHKLLQIS